MTHHYSKERLHMGCGESLRGLVSTASVNKTRKRKKAVEDGPTAAAKNLSPRGQK